MERTDSKIATGLDSFPFFAKYGHYVLATIVLVSIVNLILRRSKTTTTVSSTKESVVTKELSPDEGMLYILYFYTYLIELQFLVTLSIEGEIESEKYKYKSSLYNTLTQSSTSTRQPMVPRMILIYQRIFNT